MSTQPKPESWQEIAREYANEIPGMRKDFRDRLESVVLAAIERSHAALIVCRDHWKTSFEHERKNVIRLRRIVYKWHPDYCVCEDCNLVRSHTPAQPQQ